MIFDPQQRFQIGVHPHSYLQFQILFSKFCSQVYFASQEHVRSNNHLYQRRFQNYDELKPARDLKINLQISYLLLPQAILNSGNIATWLSDMTGSICQNCMKFH